MDGNSDLEVKALVRYCKKMPRNASEKIIGRISQILPGGMYKLDLITGEKGVVAHREDLETISTPKMMKKKNA